MVYFKKRFQIICIEGSGISFNQEDTVCSAVSSLLNQQENVEGIVQQYTPFRFKKKREQIIDVINIFNNENTPIIFIAKSLGAYRLAKNLHWLYSHMKMSRAVNVLLIDPYAPFGFCNDKNSIDLLWVTRTDINLWNVRQRKKWPKGARVEGATNRWSLLSDHKSIIHSSVVRDIFNEMIYVSPVRSL